MKTVLSAIVAAVIGFAVAYAYVSHQADVQLKQEREANAADKARLEAALAAVGQAPARVRTVEVASSAPSPAKLTAQEILDRLLEIHPGSRTNRAHSIRLVIYYLQMLADTGPEALPPVSQFFARNLDVDYSVEDDGTNANGNRGRGGRGFAFGFRRGQQLRMDFVLPPSLRLGLVDVVREVGGSAAEKILAGVLTTTGRGVEVAYLAHTLEAMAPGKYRDLALSSAKELLLNLPTIDDPNRYDANAKGYLYSVLEMYNDTSFVGKAQTLLVSGDGQIDRDALNYLSTTLKDQAVPTLYAAYKDPRVTNQLERATLANQVLGYAGQSPQANALFGEIVNDTTLNPGLRAFTVMRLAGGGGGGPFGAESPTDPAVINARKDLLAMINPANADERLVRAAEATAQNLQNLLDGKPIENPFRGGGGFGGGGGRRNRQQQDQQNVPGQ